MGDHLARIGIIVTLFTAIFVPWWKDRRQKFEGEFKIKAELSGFANDLRVGGRPKPIESVYGAEYVKSHHLFGDYGTQVVYWYNEFEDYNTIFRKLEEKRQSLSSNAGHDEMRSLADQILTRQNSMANQIDGMLKIDWLKRIPDKISNSGLSRTKFLWYLLKQDALEEPTRNKDYLYAAMNKLLRRSSGAKYGR